MQEKKFLRENLAFVVECEGYSKPWYMWVYKIEKSLYIVSQFWEHKCHHSIQTKRALSREIEEQFYAKVRRVIPESELSKRSISKSPPREENLSREELMKRARNERAKTAKAMQNMPRDAARIVGGAVVATFKPPRSNVQWAEKKRKRK